MKIIAHRGNINGPNPIFENDPSYIDIALKKTLDAEIDVWVTDGSIYLGHDKPKHLIAFEWIESRWENLWIHCKNYEALYLFSSLKKFNFFWHEKDQFTLTSHGFIWTYPNMHLGNQSICVLPEIGFQKNIDECYGICTDYADVYGKQYGL